MTLYPFEYKNAIVSELAWVIGSAPLLGNSRGDQNIVPSNLWMVNQFDLHKEWLSVLDEDPSGLIRFVQDRNDHLLGKRFETLILYWFSESPFIDLLYANVQLNDEHSTVGEIDFIIRDRENGELIHLEAACKYYLGSSGSSSWSSWLGPNSEDSLQSKMNKLDEQLSIFKKSSGRNFLQRQGLDFPTSLIFLKGYFFHRFDQLGKSSQPKFHHQQCCTGWWMHVQDLAVLRTTPAQWIALPRERWIGPYYNWDESLKRMTGEEIEDNFRSGDKHFRSAMIIQLNENNYEISRGIVVPDKWPYSIKL